MQHLIDKIQELQLVLSESMPIKDDFKRKLDDKFRLEFSYNSNHLEGNTLTYGETKLLLIFGKTEGNHNKREYDEIEAHDVAFKLIQEWAKDEEQPLTETRIKELNQIILVKPFYKEAITQDGQATRRLIQVGEYKKYPNNVLLQNGEIFNFSSPTDTPIEMGELMEWYKDELEKKELHPIILAALLHYRFVRIHPFDDGNGRISRLLVNYVLLKNNLPPIVIKSSDKKNYLDALNKADTGNINAFVEYIAEQLIWSLGISIKAAKGESIEEAQDWEKKLTLLKGKLGEDDVVKMKHSLDSVMNIVNKSVVPLIKLWDEKLKQFEVFFNTKTYKLSKVGSVYAYTKLDLLSKDLLTPRDKVYNSITIQTSFSSLRFGKGNNNYNAGEIRIYFHTNSYEVFSSVSKKTINKLYTKQLTENQIQTIVNDLCTWFYSNIEIEIINAREENID